MGMWSEFVIYTADWVYCFFSTWIPKDRSFSLVTQVLQQLLEHRRSKALIWRRVWLVHSTTSLIKVRTGVSFPVWLKYTVVSDIQISKIYIFLFFIFLGKLKPFGEIKENTTGTAGNTATFPDSHQKNYKQHQVKTRYVKIEHLLYCQISNDVSPILAQHDSPTDISLNDF